MSKIIDQFEVLRKIQKDSKNSQREMARELGFSLGKMNYCIKELKKKGLIKIKNFEQKENKLITLKYIVTPKGIKERINLTVNFMKKKLQEYDELKEELNQKK